MTKIIIKTPNLEFAKKMIWFWNNKPLELNKLHNNQLTSILRTLTIKPRNWYGTNSKVWETNIKMIIKSRYTEDYNVPSELLKIINKGYQNRSRNKAEIIIKHFNKSNLLKP